MGASYTIERLDSYSAKCFYSDKKNETTVNEASHAEYFTTKPPYSQVARIEKGDNRKVIYTFKNGTWLVLEFKPEVLKWLTEGRQHAK